MKKRTAIVLASACAIIVLGATAAIAGPLIYRDVIVGPADAAPELTTSQPSASASPVSADDLQGDWAVGDGSYAGYRVDEVLNGTDVTVTGRTDKVTGALTVTGNQLTAARIEVDVASIATDSASRDAYFHDTAMRADEFPTATFELTAPVTATAAPQAGAAQQVQATGALTLAGETRTVTVALDAVWTGNGGQVVGSIPITFSDFGVDAPDLGFVSVEPTGFVEFSLQLVRG